MSLRPLIALALLALLPPALAGTDPADASLAPEARGKAIAQEAYRRDRGFGDEEATLTMVLSDARGRERTRQMRFRTLERDDDGDWMIAVFDDPADVRGTASLTHSKALAPDDQWLYLPATHRVRRIASNNKSTPFMGSEFSYEDLGPQDISKYRFKWVRDEPLDGTAMHVLERIPKDPDSGYARQVVWMDQANLRLHKVAFYDRRDRLQKTLTAEGFTQHDGRYWRPLQLEMRNHQSGRSTTLRFEDYRFDVGLSARDFDENRLANVR